jgi:hypothetical protein
MESIYNRTEGGGGKRKRLCSEPPVFPFRTRGWRRVSRHVQFKVFAETVLQSSPFCGVKGEKIECLIEETILLWHQKCLCVISYTVPGNFVVLWRRQSNFSTAHLGTFSLNIN